MKWFKHLVASGSDPDIGEIMDDLGFEGYYMFFRTIEVMAREFSIDHPGQLICKFDWFLDQFSRKIKKKTLIIFLKKSHEKGRILYNIERNNLTLYCPKLKDLCDEYTEKIIKKSSGQNPDQNPDFVGIPSVIYNLSSNSKIEFSSKEGKGKSGQNPDYESRHYELAQFLEKSIKENVPYHKFTGKKYLESWARDFRLMESKDDIDFKMVREVLIWSQQDSFWRINILSAGTFREKFGQLAAKCNFHNGEYRMSQVGEYKPKEKPVFKGDSYSKVYEAMIAQGIKEGQTEDGAATSAGKFMVTAECILRGDPQAFERWNKSSQEPERLIKIVSDIVPDWKTRGEFAS